MVRPSDDRCMSTSDDHGVSTSHDEGMSDREVMERWAAERFELVANLIAGRVADRAAVQYELAD
jgi:hypothetical protein